jgi:ADP-ribose pyrophosphatase
MAILEKNLIAASSAQHAALVTTESTTGLADTEKCVSSERVFRGNFLQIQRDTVELPDGSLATREYVLHPGAVVVIAAQADGKLIVERQYRSPFKREFIEFPAGKMDEGESVLACAARELREETGYAAAELAYVGAMHNAIAYSDEVIHIVLARGLRFVGQALDHGEYVECFESSFEELAEQVARGLLTDAKTITCLFWLMRLRTGSGRAGSVDALLWEVSPLSI